MLFDIETGSHETVERSFDRIARDLLLNYGIKINDNFFRLSEIEFYYFDEQHSDNYAIKHTRAAGEWLVHRRGLELTLAGGTKRYGGILIRGIYNKNRHYTNGPQYVINELFKNIGNVGKKSFIQFMKTYPVRKKIFKTPRYKLNPSKNKDFFSKKYRYLVDLEHLNIEKADKENISKEHKALI